MPLHTLATDTVDRWRITADRAWSSETSDVYVHCSAERIRACLDTLIENAVRYTRDGGTVRVICSRVGNHALIGVADSGDGLDDCASWSINNTESTSDTVLASSPETDPKSQTGLGLSLVHETAEVLGGRLVAGRSAEGGALLLMVLPAAYPTSGTTVESGLAVVA